MGTVEVFTKERMLGVENSSVVGGTVNVAGNLILTRKDGTTIDAGDVKRLVPPRLAAANNVGSVINPDTLTESGFYSASSWSGSLSGNAVGTLIVKQHTPSWIVQEFTTVAAVPRSYTRSWVSNTTWGAWVETVNKSNLMTTVDLSRKTGVVSTLWTVGNPLVTLSDATVVSAKLGSRDMNVMPGDSVICEYISGSWHVMSVTETTGPVWTKFIPLPFNSSVVIRPWDIHSWGIKSSGFRDYDVSVPMWMTKNSSGVVSFSGFASTSGIAANAVFATLPVGFRPSTRRWFPVAVNDVRHTVQILPTGEMSFLNVAIAANSWMSFAQILFHDTAQDLNWVNISTFLNGFSSNNVASPVSVALDSFGFVWTRGVLNVGTRTDNTTMFNFPTDAYTSSLFRHLVAASDGNSFVGVRANAPDMLYKIGTTGSYVSLDGVMWHPSAIDSLYFGRGPGSTTDKVMGINHWTNAWKNYGPTAFSPAAYAKRADGLVVLAGFIDGGAIGTSAFTMPYGWRPFIRNASARVSNVTYGRLNIDVTGTVMPEVGANIWFSIDGVAYQAAQ